MGCKHRALIIITRDVTGTASNLAQARIELTCKEAEGHSGPHRDAKRNETWQDRGNERTHIMRAEDGS